MRPLSNNPSAIKRRERYAAAKAAKLKPVLDPETAQPEINESPVTVEVTENTAPKPTLKERLFGVQVAEPKKSTKKGRGKQIDASLMSKVLPTMISGSIALYAKKLVKDPYKACAPTQQEVFSTIGPLFNILARRVEIVGTASEDIIDLIHALIAGIVTGIRMHITYMTIQEQIERAKQHDGHHNAASRGFSASIGPNQATVSPGRESIVSLRPSDDSSAGFADGDTTLADGTDGNAKREAAIFADLFKRDIEGRRRLGLLS